MSLQAELERRRELVVAQERRVAELESEREQSAARVRRARSALADHYRERELLGAPVAEDPEEEALIAAVREAEGGLTLRPMVYPHGGGVADIGLEPVDGRVEAMLTGARELLKQRRDELRAFAEANLSGIAVERANRARELADDADAALRQARLAAAEYEGERHWWTRLLNEAGRQEWCESVPSNPLAVLAQAPIEVAVPMPEVFTG